MNLDSYVSGVVGAVNPRVPLTVRLQSGYSTAGTGAQVPSFQTPAAFVAEISGNVLDVSVATTGYLGELQTVSGPGVAPGTVITKQLSGTKGGVGTYGVNIAQTIDAIGMTSVLVLPGQVQPVQWKDLAHFEGLNLNGTRKKIYLYGVVEGVVRSLSRGGSLIDDPYGNVWLVALVMEQWYHDKWCAVAATLQNERTQ